MRPNLPFLSAPSNAILKPDGLLRWKVKLVKDARLSLSLTKVMKIIRLISPLLDAPPLLVIAKTKAETWQTTCSSLSPKSNPKTVYSLFRSIAGSPSSSSSSPNFPNCSSPRDSASVYAAYLRSHFSVSQPKAVRGSSRGYLSELRPATCPEVSHTSFCSPFSPAEFLAVASNLFLVYCHWPRQSCLSQAKAYSSLWYEFSSSHLQSLLDFAFFSFYLEDIFYYYNPQDGKTCLLSCFLSAYLSHLLRIKAF